MHTISCVNMVFRRKRFFVPWFERTREASTLAWKRLLVTVPLMSLSVCISRYRRWYVMVRFLKNTRTAIWSHDHESVMFTKLFVLSWRITASSAGPPRMTSRVTYRKFVVTSCTCNQIWTVFFRYHQSKNWYFNITTQKRFFTYHI